MDDRRLIGKKCEELACTFLKKHGYKILAQNWRCRFGEVDIIAFKSGELIFVEVKSGQNKYFNPLDKINEAKKSKLTDLASYYLTYVYKREVSVRFDAISVLLADGRAEIDHVKNAF